MLGGQAGIQPLKELKMPAESAVLMVTRTLRHCQLLLGYRNGGQMNVSSFLSHSNYFFFFALLQNLKLLSVLYGSKLYSYLFYITHLDFFSGLVFAI